MPTYIARQKRTRVVYVVLLCVAIAMSTFAVYNQVHSDSTSAQFADQISAFCADNPAYSNDHFNCQQAKNVQDNGSAVIQGPPGQNGKDGHDGKDGQSIAGPPGPPGATGDRGMNGNPGIDGKTVVGPQGQTGQVGPPGVKGDKGDTGDRGADGQPGENAPTPKSQQFVVLDNGCNLATTYSDNETLYAKAPEVMCI